jgi:nitrite reductase/ring-hydroxylating ferredoxin subunit
MVFAAKATDVPLWGKKLVSVNGREILLVNAKGTIYACEPECPHQGAPLSGALIKDAEHLTCQRHGYRFNLRSGECKEFPDYTLKVYPVQVREGEVFVDLG